MNFYDDRTAAVSLSCWAAQMNDGEAADFLHRQCPGPVVIMIYGREFDCECPHHQEEASESD